MVEHFKIDYDKSTNTAWLGSECGSGAVYTGIKTTKDLKNAVNKYIDNYISSIDEGIVEDEVSDEYHTMNELYDHRTVLFAGLIACNEDISWKSKNHSDGSYEDGWFIAGINLPTGQITYHQKIEYWDLFKCKELNYAPEWDGHTPNDVLDRLTSAILGREEVE